MQYFCSGILWGILNLPHHLTAKDNALILGDNVVDAVQLYTEQG